MTIIALLLGRLPSGLWTAHSFGDEERQQANDLGYTTVTSDVGPCQTKAELLARVSGDLSFPDYFGANWDALAESTGDWVATNPQSIWIIDGLDALHATNSTVSDTFVDIVAEVFTAADGNTSCVVVGSHRLDSVPSLDEVS